MIAPVDQERLFIKIPGEPVPQARGRAIPTARGLRVKDPERSLEWKRIASAYMRLTMRARPPLSGPVGVEVLVVMPCPKKDRRKRVPAERRWDARHVGDADNFLKGCLDAANGVLFHDDCQVADARVRRVIGGQDEEPRVEVQVWGLDEET